MQLTLNDVQRKVIEVYGKGDFSHVTMQQELDECGDGLFRFLMVELSSSEDCTDVETACQRVANAIGDLENVLQHLETLETDRPAKQTETYRGHMIEVWRTDDPMEPPSDDPKAVGPFEFGDWYSRVKSLNFELDTNVTTYELALRAAKNKIDETVPCLGMES